MYSKELAKQLVVKIYNKHPNPVFSPEEISQFVEDNFDKLQNVIDSYLRFSKKKRRRNRRRRFLNHQ